MQATEMILRACYATAPGLSKAHIAVCLDPTKTLAQVEDVLGQRWTLVAPPEVAAYGERFLAGLFSESPQIPDEWRIRRRDAGPRLRVVAQTRGSARRVFSTPGREEKARRQ